jgi:hypothetical protein
MKTLFVLVICCFAISLSAATWTGELSVDWNTPGNWSTGVVPNSAQPVYIVTGVANWPEVSTANASCSLLNLAAGTSLSISGSFYLHVYGPVTCSGNLSISGSGDLIIDGNVQWQDGAVVSVTNTNAEIIALGHFTVYNYANFNMSAGVLLMMGNLDTLFQNYSHLTTLAHFWINKTTGHSVEITSASVYNLLITTGIRVYGGSLLINNAPAQITLNGYLEDMNILEAYGLRFNAGLVKLDGSSQSIAVHSPGSYLANISRNGTSGTAATLQDSLTIKGNLYLYSGSLLTNGFNLHVGGTVYLNGGFLDLMGVTVTVGRDWSLQSGGIITYGSRVIFNGTGHQYCNCTAAFDTLEVNKTDGSALRIDDPDAVVTVYHYDWTAGAIDILQGTLNISNLDDGYIAGAWYLNPGGIINLNLDAEAYIDLGGDLHIFGGEFNVYGGAGTYPSYWPYNHSASLEMTGGLLDFKDQGVYITDDYPAWSFSETITGGTIRVAQRFEVYRTDFNPTGGTIDFSGSTDARVMHEAGSNLFNLYINKTAARDETPSVIRYRDGTQITLLRTNTVAVHSALDLNGFIWVQSGRLDLNQKTVDCAGHVYVNTGILEIDSGAILNMANGKAIAVNDGGRLEVLGTSGSAATITCPGGYYYLGIWSGGTIAASYAVFEKLQVEGVNVRTGSLVDPNYSFTNCTFRNGIAGGTLLTLNNSQNLLINGAAFPNNTWGGTYNVSKSEDAGVVNFASATGTFAGEANDNDTWDRIVWTSPTAAYDFRVLKAKWSELSVLLGQTVTLTVTYLNAGTIAWSGAYNYLDLYWNRSVPPGTHTPGNQWYDLSSIPAGLPVDYTFSVTNTDSGNAGVWNSYLQIDTDESVAESNEANNVYGPFSITWISLPAITDLSITRTAGPGILLDWTYSTPVDGFRIYRHTEFFTEANPAYYLSSVAYPVTEYSEAATGTNYFYLVTAELTPPARQTQALPASPRYRKPSVSGE